MGQRGGGVSGEKGSGETDVSPRPWAMITVAVCLETAGTTRAAGGAIFGGLCVDETWKFSTGIVDTSSMSISADGPINGPMPGFPIGDRIRGRRGAYYSATLEHKWVVHRLQGVIIDRTLN